MTPSSYHDLLILVQANTQGPGVPQTGVDPLPFVLVAGVIVLGLLLAYGIIRNRNRTAGERRRTEEATRELQRQEQETRERRP